MARALMGHVGMPSQDMLALEIGRLRRRVSELEVENARLREHATDLLSPTSMSTVTADLDLELHRIAEGAPVLA